MRNFLSRMKGGAKCPPSAGISEVVWSFLGSIAGTGILGYLSAAYFEPRDMTMIIGSFGASAVLVYAAIKSPLAQPRNLIGGHIISGLVGVLCFRMFGGTLWVAAAFSVSLSIAAMLMTRTLHPPGGATALIAVIGGEKIHDFGFLYAFVPAGLGAAILLAVALLVNNLSMRRRYPEYWY